MKGKEEKERYTYMNAEFQRTARRDSIAFLSDQCKEIRGNNRMERLEVSSRKLGIPRNISWKYFTGTIKDNNGIHLTEAEDVKKRWQEYTEELYRKDLHDLNNHDDVITHRARHPGV